MAQPIRGKLSAMPWCDPCDRFFNPNTLRPDGTCSVCGTMIASRRERKQLASGAPFPAVGEDGAPFDADAAEGSAPWHFKLLVGSAALYLGWRAVQAVDWVWHRLA